MFCCWREREDRSVLLENMLRKRTLRPLSLPFMLPGKIIWAQWDKSSSLGENMRRDHNAYFFFTSGEVHAYLDGYSSGGGDRSTGSFTRLFTFRFVLMKGIDPFFSPRLFQLHVNSRADWILSPWLGNQSRRKKTEFKPPILRLIIDLLSHHICDRGTRLIHTSGSQIC